MSAIYTFTQNQLKVLLKGMGCFGITGPALKSKVLDNQSVLNALNELNNLKIIESDGKEFIVKPDVKQIINRISSADKCVFIRTPDRELPDICCYAGNPLLICSYSTVDPERISFEFTDFESLFLRLSDEGYLNDVKESGLPPEDEILESFERKQFDEADIYSPLSASSRLFISAVSVNKKGKILGCVNVVDYYFYSYLLFFDGYNFSRGCCNIPTLKNHIERLIKFR